MAISGWRISTITHFAGLEIGASDWLTIDQKWINQFVDYIGDYQWIHINVGRSR